MGLEGFSAKNPQDRLKLVNVCFKHSPSAKIWHGLFWEDEKTRSSKRAGRENSLNPGRDVEATKMYWGYKASCLSPCSGKGKQ